MHARGTLPLAAIAGLADLASGQTLAWGSLGPDTGRGGWGDGVDGGALSLLLGLLGGVSCMLAPCLCLCRCLGHDEARSLLFGPMAAPRATAALVPRPAAPKAFQSPAAGEGPSPTSCCINVAAEASDPLSMVAIERTIPASPCGRASVGDDCWGEACEVSNMADFAFAGDLECWVADGPTLRWVPPLLGCFAFAGIAFAATALMTGSYLGLGVFAALALASPALGYVLFSGAPLSAATN